MSLEEVANENYLNPILSSSTPQNIENRSIKLTKRIVKFQQGKDVEGEFTNRKSLEESH